MVTVGGLDVEEERQLQPNKRTSACPGTAPSLVSFVFETVLFCLCDAKHEQLASPLAEHAGSIILCPESLEGLLDRRVSQLRRAADGGKGYGERCIHRCVCVH
ncbi:hypothetical protein JZ751_011789 [Albula glossodonta]|uniref:Uncharacterized protein n=1 Tax=Albula glossodonta TaxID=121402 RepID=A0A8T2PQL3_9TELE|nr:hypothetical protein JZ751_011789 [Albula glossodonta]